MIRGAAVAVTHVARDEHTARRHRVNVIVESDRFRKLDRFANRRQRNYHHITRVVRATTCTTYTSNTRFFRSYVRRSPSISLQTTVQRSVSPLIAVVCLFRSCCLHTHTTAVPKPFGRIALCVWLLKSYTNPYVHVFSLFRFFMRETQYKNVPLSNPTCISNFLAGNCYVLVLASKVNEQ